MEMPPESKVTPLPTSTTGLSPLLPPLYSSDINLAGSRLPRDTESREPMPSFSMAASSSTLTFSFLYDLPSSRAWLAR